jgi:hypothetical protein
VSGTISGSVGRWEKRARNLPKDVELVQQLLEMAAEALQAPELDPKGVDGEIAPFGVHVDPDRSSRLTEIWWIYVSGKNRII